MFQENLDLPRYFQAQKFCFKRIGIDLSEEKNIITSYFWNIVPQLSAISLAVSLLHHAGEHISEVDEVTDTLGPFWQIGLSMLKYVTFMYKRREIVQLVKILSHWASEVDSVERVFIVAEQKIDIRFNRTYLYLVTITGYLVVVKPFLIGLAAYLLNGEFLLVPPIKATYPYDMNNKLVFFLTDIWIFFGVYSVIYTSVGVDGLFSWATRSVIAQFLILRSRLQQAALENDGQSSKQSIVECIKYHRRIIDTVQQLNDVLGSIIFAKFTFSCMQICFLAYQLSRIKNFADAAFQATFLISVALQLIIYCLNGQRIRDESFNVVDYIFNAFQWEKLDTNSRRLLLLSMVRAKRVCSLSGIFFVVDLSLYLWVFRTAASYIALLFTIDEKK